VILGIGNDLIDIRRIEASLERFGDRFEGRIFTASEREKAHSRSNAGSKTIAATYAKRFAAKEACIKALNAARGLSWHDMEIINTPSGAPSIQLSGVALTHLNTLLPSGTYAAIHLSLTDEYPYALAQIIIEARTTSPNQ